MLASRRASLCNGKQQRLILGKLESREWQWDWSFSCAMAYRSPHTFTHIHKLKREETTKFPFSDLGPIRSKCVLWMKSKDLDSGLDQRWSESRIIAHTRLHVTDSGRICLRGITCIYVFLPGLKLIPEVLLRAWGTERTHSSREQQCDLNCLLGSRHALQKVFSAGTALIHHFQIGKRNRAAQHWKANYHLEGLLPKRGL